MSEKNYGKIRSHIEHMLDITLSLDDKTFYIYDVSSYFRGSNEADRERYMKRVRYAISGKNHTVNIICDMKELTYDFAKQIAIKHVENSLDVYRLD